MTLMCDSWETLQGEIRCNPFGGQQLRTFLNNNPKINNITSTSLAFTLILNTKYLPFSDRLRQIQFTKVKQNLKDNKNSKCHYPCYNVKPMCPCLKTAPQKSANSSHSGYFVSSPPHLDIPLKPTVTFLFKSFSFHCPPSPPPK